MMNFSDPRKVWLVSYPQGEGCFFPSDTNCLLRTITLDFPLVSKLALIPTDRLTKAFCAYYPSSYYSTLE